jgi:hypothetical protein
MRDVLEQNSQKPSILMTFLKMQLGKRFLTASMMCFAIVGLCMSVLLLTLPNSLLPHLHVGGKKRGTSPIQTPGRSSSWLIVEGAMGAAPPVETPIARASR